MTSGGKMRFDFSSFVKNIMASVTQDKESLVAIHEKARSELWAASQRGDQMICITQNSIPTPLAPHLSLLRPVSLSELQIGTIHTNRVLFGTLCVHPFKMNAVQTVIEDLQGKACRLFIYKVEESEVATKYPNGLRVAIREPFFKVGNDGSNILRVNEPRNIDTVTEFPAEFDPSFLKAEGNRLFRAKNWDDAVHHYTLCLAACKLPQHREIVLACLSNRSEALIRMQAFGRALEDANKALEIDPSHLKSLYRKARALAHLKQCDVACRILEDAITQYPGEQQLVDALKQIVLSDKQI